MEKRIIIPTLSDKGFVESTRTVLARLLAYYITTDAAQSFVYSSDIISLPMTYSRHINAPNELADAISLDLTNLLGAYYEHKEVETEVRFDSTGSKADIGLFATVVDNLGVKVGLGKVVEIDPTGLGNVIDVNNFGEAKRLIRR